MKLFQISAKECGGTSSRMNIPAKVKANRNVTNKQTNKRQRFFFHFSFNCLPLEDSCGSLRNIPKTLIYLNTCSLLGDSWERLYNFQGVISRMLSSVGKEYIWERIMRNYSYGLVYSDSYFQLMMGLSAFWSGFMLPRFPYQ